MNCILHTYKLTTYKIIFVNKVRVRIASYYKQWIGGSIDVVWRGCIVDRCVGEADDRACIRAGMLGTNDIMVDGWARGVYCLSTVCLASYLSTKAVLLYVLVCVAIILHRSIVRHHLQTLALLRCIATIIQITLLRSHSWHGCMARCLI